jgi:hypothetical protein
LLGVNDLDVIGGEESELAAALALPPAGIDLKLISPFLEKRLSDLNPISHYLLRQVLLRSSVDQERVHKTHELEPPLGRRAT